MAYKEALTYLDRLGVDAMKSMSPSLHRMEALCEVLDHPERQVPALHITGTNGKTSTARIAASLLQATGLSVGTYTSPHLQTVRERIALGNDPISEEDFGAAFDHLFPYLEVVEDKLGERLTFFEVLTGMFFLWAADTAVNAMVLEVGLGGRWDATNVVDAPVGLITNVALDHTGLLGTERPTIAKEKSGIVKPASTVVTGERLPDVLAVIEAEASGVGAETAVLGRDFDVTSNETAVGGRFLSVRTSRSGYEDLFLPLHGAHQGVNATLALEAVGRFVGGEPLSDEVVAEGFAKTTVPGRLESMPVRETSVVLDVAHNPDGISAFVSGLLGAFAFERLIVVLGILEDKDHLGMLTELTRIPCHVITTEAKSVRSRPPDELAAAAQNLGLSSEVVLEIDAAIDHALGLAGEGELVSVTGSHYVVGDARTHLKGKPH